MASSSGSESIPPSQFQAIFDAALREYTKKTGNELATHPLSKTLEKCNFTDKVLDVLQAQAHAFNQFRNGDWRMRLMRRLKPSVDILLALSNSGVLGGSIGLKFPPARAIFAGIGLLLAAAKGVSTSYDALVDLFECFDSYLRRLRIFTEIPSAVEEILAKIMAELLGVLALADQQIKQGRIKKFAKKLLGENEIETVLQRLDRLTTEESRMTVAQTMEIVYGLFNNMKIVMDDGKASTDNIREALVTMQQIAEDVIKINHAELQKNVRNWLSPPDPSVNHNIACEAHHTGTAAWFLQGAVYREWKATGSLLWAHGKPGSGKSVLCSSIINDIKDLARTGLASIAFYYFDFKDTRKQDCRGLVSSLLTQLCARSDHYCNILSELYSKHNNGLQQPSVQDLTQCLKNVLALSNQGEVYIIVDAIDECPNNYGMPSSRKRVLGVLQELVAWHLPYVHVCVASRPEVDIQVVMEPLTNRCVSIHKEGGQRQDIIDYIESAVESDPKMRRWRAEDKRLVIDTLSRKADGMFRWVFCQLDKLQRCFPGSLRRALEELPNTLDETYARILMEIDEEKWEYAYRLLQCLTVARRPLHAKELAEVLAVEVGAEGTPELNLDLRPADADEAVLSACSSLVVIVEVDTYSDSDSYPNPYCPRGHRPVIQFSHFSVKEFLTSDRLTAFSTRNVSRYYISLEPAHTVFARSCICTLLRLDHLTVAQNLSLAEYAAPNWFHHVQSGGVSPQVEDGMKCLFDPERPNFMAWVSMHDVDRDSLRIRRTDLRPQASPLCYAAFLGLSDVVKYLVTTRRQDPNEHGCAYGTPLHAAFYQGHNEIARFLVDNGANINTRTPWGSTLLFDVARIGHPYLHALGLNDTIPLRAASQSGPIAATKVLLEWGADVNARDNEGVTPLYRGVESRNPGLARLLLRFGADVHSWDFNNSTLLHAASKWGAVAAAEVLLEWGASINARDKEGVTPLYKGVETQHPEMARLLLRFGADVHSRDFDNSTPLHAASQRGAVAAAEVLLEWGADVNARDMQDSSPLHRAARFRNLGTVQLLLRFGADIHARDHHNSTPLHAASESGPEQLFSWGTDRGEQDTSPFQRAQGFIDLEMVRLLLRFDADIHARDFNDSTRLHTASLGWNVRVVRALFEHANSRNEQVNTSVRHESQWEHLVNARDQFSWTPLHLASLRGHFDLARFLIDHGADTDARNINGQTPFSIALERGHRTLARFLSGVEVEAHSNR